MPTWQRLAPVTARESLTPEYFALTLRAPELAAAAQPGLFVNVLIPAPEVCLRRPISFYRATGDEITLLVGVHGQGTAALSRVAVGESLDLLGPLGGRPLRLRPGARRVALVGGGVGIPPLAFFAARHRGAAALTAYVGARNAGRLLGVQEFGELGVAVRASTDDGSVGFQGTVAALLAADLPAAGYDLLLACGPTPMLRAVAALALAAGVACEVCLEARMACAVGACLSCVVETTREGWQKYQRVCTEGPVFEAADIVWQSLSPLCAP
ncbi:MAG: dihydroorotate dehydrogenase electron transfer subunit [Fimbriimonadaceae bacterium]|nr:dihydroorotate dehydrogenase electron transfer subunit [Fimbriimonadaceae bacterium]